MNFNSASGSRFLSSLGFQQFLVSDNTSGELVEEGKELVRLVRIYLIYYTFFFEISIVGFSRTLF